MVQIKFVGHVEGYRTQLLCTSETKGREDLTDPGKWERLQQWCADASALDGGQQYKPLFVREEDWEQYKPKTFHDAIAAFSS